MRYLRHQLLGLVLVGAAGFGCKMTGQSKVAAFPAALSTNTAAWSSQRIMQAVINVRGANGGNVTLTPDYNGLTEISRQNLNTLTAKVGQMTDDETKIYERALTLNHYVAHNSVSAAIPALFSGDVPTLKTKADRNGDGSQPSVARSYDKYFDFEDREYGAKTNTFGTVGGSAGRDMYGEVTVHLDPKSDQRPWGSTGAGHGFAKSWYLAPCKGEKDCIEREKAKFKLVEVDPNWTPPDALLSAFAEKIYVAADWNKAIALGAIDLIRQIKDSDQRTAAIRDFLAVNDVDDPDKAIETWWKLAGQYRVAYMEAKFEGSVPLTKTLGLVFSDQATYDLAMKSLEQTPQEERDKIANLMSMRPLDPPGSVFPDPVETAAIADDQKASSDKRTPRDDPNAQRSGDKDGSSGGSTPDAAKPKPGGRG